MAEHNIKINVKTETDYDTLYPATKAELVSFNKSGTDLSANNANEALRAINTKVNNNKNELKNKTLNSLSEVMLASQKGFYLDALTLKELAMEFYGKEYTKEQLNISNIYNVMDFKCVKKGNMVFFNISLNTSSTLIPNYLYNINNSPIPAELRPNYMAYLNGFGCDGTWHKTTALSTYIDKNGYIKYDTPVKQTFYKISGFWFV